MNLTGGPGADLYEIGLRDTQSKLVITINDYEASDSIRIVNEDSFQQNTLVLELIDRLGAQNGEPILDNPFTGFRIIYNGEFVTIDFRKVSGADATYEDLLAAIQEALSSNPATSNFTASLGETFSVLTWDRSEQVEGTSIIIDAPGGVITPYTPYPRYWTTDPWIGITPEGWPLEVIYLSVCIINNIPFNQVLLQLTKLMHCPYWTCLALMQLTAWRPWQATTELYMAIMMMA